MCFSHRPAVKMSFHKKMMNSQRYDLFESLLETLTTSNISFCKTNT